MISATSCQMVQKEITCMWGGGIHVQGGEDGKANGGGRNSGNFTPKYDSFVIKSIVNRK